MCIRDSSKAALTVTTECLDAQLRADTDGRLSAAVFYPSGNGLLATGLWTSDRNRPDDLERERPRDTPGMTVEGLQKMAKDAGRELTIQPLDELADMVVDGIKDGRFIMILPMERTETTLRARLNKVLANQNPTEIHDVGG